MAKKSTKRRQAQGLVGGAATPPTSQANSNDPNITYVRTEVGLMQPKWTQVKDCLEGARKIKEKGTLYLPLPMNDPDPKERELRYATYKERAQFFNFTLRTLNGMIGQVFSRDPILTGGSYLTKLSTNIDGAGTTLDQQAKKALGSVIAYGRAGILADYPSRQNGATMAEIQELKVRPAIQLFMPWQVINWREAVIDGNKVYTLIVIQQQAESADDGFQVTYEDEWRVLRLVNGVYHAEVWRKNQVEAAYRYSGDLIPRDADGNPFDRIPFSFIGSSTNDSSVDEPPLYDLSEINIGHYRNSADYEEACFIVGQPTLAISGLTQQWVEMVWKGPIYLGSRAAVTMPSGAKAELLQVQPNSMPFEAMKHKETQAIALGALLIQERTGTKTFGESQSDEMNNSSYLATCAKNVSAAYTSILPYLLAFTQGAALRVQEPDTKDPIMYDLNTDFPAARMTPNERTQLIAEWMDGAITTQEMRDGLRKAGVATDSYEAYKKELEENPSPNQVKATQEAEMAQKALDVKNANRPQPVSNAPNGGNQAGN